MHGANGESKLIHAELTEQIIGAAIEVHRELGPGLLESTYQACLMHELMARGLSCRRQVELPVIYKGIQIDRGYRIDLLVEGQIVIELRAIDKLDPIHSAQLITYMRLGALPVGLLINFNVKLLKDGIVRFADTTSPLRALRDLRGETS